MKKLSQAEGSSADIITENIEEMKKIFPDVFNENGINFEALRQLLADAKVLDEGEEKYGLNWHGKKKARQIALTPSTGTLRPCLKDGIDWDTTQNLFIEGDNLEVLKLLQKSYANKVKVIYIDPPYNTDQDFIYPDKFSEGLDTYLAYTGQKGDEGWNISESGRERTGRKHTSWLNMIYPRLKLAKNLLKHDGIIFVSIDDHEVANLIQVLREIFGEENQCAIIHRRKNRKPHNAGETMSLSYEFLLAFYKNDKFKLTQEFAEMKSDEKGNFAIYPVVKADKKERVYTFPMGIKCEARLWKKGIISAGRNRNLDIELLDEPIISNGILKNDVRIKGRFCLTDENGMLSAAFREGNIYINDNGFPKEKRYRTEDDSKIDNHHWDVEKGKNEDGDEEIKGLFGLAGENNLFKYPKPTALIKKLLNSAYDPDALIMDFFAGSASTADGVMQQNLEDGGNRKFILVQLPEKLLENKREQIDAYEFCTKNKLPPTIAEISKERIRRAAKKIKRENPDYNGDLGFKVFKLDSSNIRAWNPDAADLEKTLLDNAEHLVAGRSDEDVLYELLLKRGVDLTVPIESKKVAGKSVYSIGHGVLFACLATTIKRDEVEEIASGIVSWFEKLKPATETHVFFRDSAFADDVTKTNLSAILGQHGITHVRSL